MTKIKTRSANRNDLSHIDTLDDLRAEINAVKGRIKVTEIDLKQRLKQVPKEGFKSAVGIVLPFYLNNKVAGKSWQVLTSLLNLVNFNKDKRSNFKKDVIGNAKKLGLFAAIRTAFTLWKKH